MEPQHNNKEPYGCIAIVSGIITAIIIWFSVLLWDHYWLGL